MALQLITLLATCLVAEHVSASTSDANSVDVHRAHRRLMDAPVGHATRSHVRNPASAMHTAIGSTAKEQLGDLSAPSTLRPRRATVQQCTTNVWECLKQEKFVCDTYQCGIEKCDYKFGDFQRTYSMLECNTRALLHSLQSCARALHVLVCARTAYLRTAWRVSGVCAQSTSKGLTKAMHGMDVSRCMHGLGRLVLWTDGIWTSQLCARRCATGVWARAFCVWGVV